MFCLRFFGILYVFTVCCCTVEQKWSPASNKQQTPYVFLSFCDPDCHFSCTVAKKHKLCCDSTAKCWFWLLKLNKTIWFCSPNHLTLPMTRYGCRVPQRLSRAVGNYRRGQITDWSCTEAFSFTNPLRKGQITDWSCSEAFSFTNPFNKGQITDWSCSGAFSFTIL